MADGEVVEESVPTEINFHYIKGNNFRVIHCDGAFGGGTPQGNIFLSVFNERSPLPQRVSHKITAEGTLGEEIKEKRISRDGVVRELEVELIMNITVAKSLRDWLDNNISKLETALNDSGKVTK